MGANWGRQEIVDASKYGVRKGTLSAPVKGVCPGGFFDGSKFGGGSVCYPAPKGDTAKEWQWADERTVKNYEGNNYYSFDIGNDGIPERHKSGRGYQSYLITEGDCVSEGGVWFDKTSETFKKNLISWDSFAAVTGGTCAMKKGVVPLFMQAARIKDKNTCEANNKFAWHSPLFGADYCYYVIPEADQYTGPGSRVTQIAQGVSNVITDAADAPVKALSWWEWLMQNWKWIVAIGGLIFLGPYIMMFFG